MACAYDGLQLSAEIAYKASVAVNVRAGWRPVPEGDPPAIPLVPLGAALNASALPAPSARAASAAAEPCMDVCPVEEYKGAENPALVAAQYELPDGVAQVFNEKRRTVHISSREGTLCRAWRCETMEAPLRSAEFCSREMFLPSPKAAVR